MSDNDTASLGKIMLVWAIMIGLAVWFLQEWLNAKNNPNAGVVRSENNELRLAPGPYHQYYVDGAINQHKVTFLVDTGASNVSVPAAVAKKSGLVGRGKYWASTANGNVQVESTRIAVLTVGGFTLENIEASINPNMDDDLILLGMSAIKYLRLSQEGDTIIFQGP